MYRTEVVVDTTQYINSVTFLVPLIFVIMWELTQSSDIIEYKRQKVTNHVRFVCFVVRYSHWVYYSREQYDNVNFFNCYFCYLIKTHYQHIQYQKINSGNSSMYLRQ